MKRLSACLLVIIAAILFTPSVAGGSEAGAVDVAPIGTVISPEWSDVDTLVAVDSIEALAAAVLREASEAAREDLAAVVDAVSQINNEKEGWRGSGWSFLEGLVPTCRTCL